jgi:hypothetical protein
MKIYISFVCLLCTFFLLQIHVVQAQGDDVLEVIEQAVNQYKQGDYAGAAGNLDYASQLVRQKKSERMKDLLPDPLDGWEAHNASAQAVGSALFGGGVTVSREYKKGASIIGIEIISDSPVLQSVMMMLNNPMFAGASGGKLQTIKGQRAIVKYDPQTREGDINIILSGKFMVTVKGQDVDLNDIILYAERIDYTIISNN